MLSVGTAGSSWGCLAIESVVCCLFPLRSTSEGWWECLSVYGWQLTSDGGMARLRAKPSINRPPEHAGCPTHSPAAVGRIDMIASRSRWESPVPPHPKGALLDWDLVTVEVIWVKWTHRHVQETSLRWFELCDTVHYPAGSTSEDGTL